MRKLLITLIVVGVLAIAQSASAQISGNSGITQTGAGSSTNTIVIVNKNAQKASSFHNYVNGVDDENWNHVVELDAPLLVKLYKNWFLGASVGKDLNGTKASEGWEAVAKVTHTGTHLDLTKKE